MEDLTPRSKAKTPVGLKERNHAKNALIRKWKGRLQWAPKEVDVYRQILAVHTLVARPIDDLDSWLDLVTMCRKEGRKLFLMHHRIPSPLLFHIHSPPLLTSTFNLFTFTLSFSSL